MRKLGLIFNITHLREEISEYLERKEIVVYIWTCYRDKLSLSEHDTLFKFLAKKNCLNLCVEWGHLELVVWAYNRGYREWQPHVCDDNNCEHHDKYIAYNPMLCVAFNKGHFHILDWFRNQGKDTKIRKNWLTGDGRGVTNSDYNDFAIRQFGYDRTLISTFVYIYLGIWPRYHFYDIIDLDGSCYEDMNEDGDGRDNLTNLVSCLYYAIKGRNKRVIGNIIHELYETVDIGKDNNGYSIRGFKFYINHPNVVKRLLVLFRLTPEERKFAENLGFFQPNTEPVSTEIWTKLMEYGQR